MEIGRGAPLFLIAGPCVLEDEDTVFDIAGFLKELTDAVGIPLIFKASYDKANRTSIDAFRGPGLTKGMRLLNRIKEKFDVSQVPENFSYNTGWATLGGITQVIGMENWLSVTGLSYVMRVLDDIENSRLRNVDFVEAMSCMLSCLGGPFNVENPYIARTNSIKQRTKYEANIHVDEKEVYQGDTARSLGYVTIPFEPTTGKSLTLALQGIGQTGDAFNIVELNAQREQAGDNRSNRGGRRGNRNNLSIVEIEIYEKADSSKQ